MITCKHATELISKSMEEPLTLKEQLLLRVHLFVCEFCEQFRKQLTLMRTVIRDGLGVRDESADESLPRLSDECKRRILEVEKAEREQGN